MTQNGELNQNLTVIFCETYLCSFSLLQITKALMFQGGICKALSHDVGLIDPHLYEEFRINCIRMI